MSCLAEKKLPEFGDKISVEKFHISETNVRAEEPFGETEEDKQLIANLRRGNVIQPFKARPEGDGYGVVVGRRRFFAKRESGAEFFVVGVDCLVENMSDEKAIEASLTENILRKDIDPIARANALNMIVSYSTTGSGIRETARRLGIAPTTLSEWLKPLELSPKMQKALSNQEIFFTDALEVTRMDLGTEKQDELAELAETQGRQAFKAELTRLPTGKRKRGIPPGKYEIVRAAFDRRYKPDMEAIKKLEKLAETKHMERNECGKWIIQQYLKTTL